MRVCRPQFWNTALRFVSPSVEGAYNVIVCCTDHQSGKGDLLKQLMNFCDRRWCENALTIDKLSSERHGVRKDMPVFPGFLRPTDPDGKKELTSRLDTLQHRVCTLQTHLNPVFWTRPRAETAVFVSVELESENDR